MTGAQHYDAVNTVLKTRRLVYAINEKMERSVVAEVPYTDSDLKLCQGNPDMNHKLDPLSRLRYMHSLHTTENYIILPETSYVAKPCSKFGNPTDPYFFQKFEYVPEIKGRFQVQFICI